MTPDAAGIEAALAAGLAAHGLRGFGRDAHGSPYMWDACGSFDTTAEWAAHVAAALLPVVTQAQAEAWDKGYELRAKTLGMTPDPNPYRAGADESGA